MLLISLYTKGRILTSLELSIPNKKTTGAVINDSTINFTDCVRRIIRYQNNEKTLQS